MSVTEVRESTEPGAERTSDVEVSIVIPCLNEAASIQACVKAARDALEAGGYDGEVVVVDNASTDNSAELAEAAGAEVIHEPRRGYGSAYLAGLNRARGKYIVMADADLTYPMEELPRFVDELADGGEMVVGDRMSGIQPGAMPWMNRYIGNPVLTGVLNLFFRTGVKDAHCGMRALRREVLPDLALRSTGMELASEMVVRASKLGLDIRQFPIEYHPREGESKLSPWRDGWRHLRFLLVHSPRHLFLYPGAVVAALGTLIILGVVTQISVFGRQWDIHAMIGGSLMLILGVQVMALGLCAQAYGAYFMEERDERFERMRGRYRLEHGLLLGGVIILAGVALGGTLIGIWIDRGFGALSEERLAVLAATLVTVGAQVFFTSFLLSILGLRRPEQR
jgi:glycosyltransferase involved in cell wall biosynthesis